MHDVHEGKLPTKDLPVRDFVTDTVCILMGMHLGAPSSPCVQKGDYVKLGQMIGEPVGPLGLPVHSSVSGEVIDVSLKQQLSPNPVMCVTIKNDHKDEWVEGLVGYGDVETVDPSLIIPAVKNAGICGMGGACFPTHVKLTVREGMYCDTIILNGAECETHLTADYRLMLEHSNKIVDGLRAAMRALNVKRGVIAIEDNKPEAIALMKKAAQGREGVEVAELVTKYPQGGEKQLIYAITGREVPSGGLPADAGCVVLNVGTCNAIYAAIALGKPLFERVVTVTGGGVNSPGNILARIGTSFRDCIAFCGGVKEDTGKILSGGPMMGVAQYTDEVPVIAGTSGILVLSGKEAHVPPPSPCIHCGRCYQVCPAGLQPYIILAAVDRGDAAQAALFHALDCVECGACAFICPAHRQLLQSMRLAKMKVRGVTAKK